MKKDKGLGNKFHKTFDAFDTFDTFDALGMKVSVNWLKELVDFPWSAAELAERLEMTGTAVEGIEDFSSPLEGVIVGKIIEITPHPHADKLVVCQIDIGVAKPSIVCGAKNISKGDKVPVARVGARLPGGTKINQANLRGIKSQGMLCSERELALGEDASGILILDQSAPVGEDLNSLFSLDDTVIDFEITPNRSDCMSMLGIAREVAAISGGKVRVPEDRLTEINVPAKGQLKVEVREPTLAPRYVGLMIQGVTVKPSPIWMQHRLTRAGVHPVNNLVDITNYVMMETGQPLHAFDCKKLAGHEVIVRKALPGERLVALDDVEYELTEDMLVIADSSRAIALAGLMGGLATEIDDGTKTVFLESAYFEPRGIYHTSAALDLRTESSSRFEKQVDPNGLIYAAKRAAKLMQDLAGGKVLKGSIDIYPRRITAKKVTIRPGRANTILGTHIGTKRITTILKSLQLPAVERGGARGKRQEIQVTVPTFRPDLEQESDLIEEVARLFGYDRIESTLPKASSKRNGLSPEQKVNMLIRETFVAAGLDEVINYSFISEDDFRNFEVAKNRRLAKAVFVKNPLSADNNILRTTLIPGLLKTIMFNLGYSRSNVQIFEVGRVFFGNGDRELPFEKIMVSGAATGSWQSDQWYEKEREIDFYDLKGIVEVLLSRLGIIDWQLKRGAIGAFHPGRAGEIMIEGKRAGILGELHPQVTKAYQLPKRVVAFELDEAELFKFSNLGASLVLPSRFPAVSFDVALVVDERVDSQEVSKVITKTGGKFLRSVQLFDIYRGKPIDKGKKSMAFSLSFQADDHTLLGSEIKKAQGNIMRAVKKELGAIIRT